MKYAWSSPTRRDAEFAVGLFHFPGGFAGARLVRPATIELEDGHFVEVPLILVDKVQDLVVMAEGLKKMMTGNLGEVSMPPGRLKGKVRRPRKKRKKGVAR